MNKVILTGRFTRDPEIKYTNDGASIARFSIAVNRRFVKEGSDQKADFLNCIAFGKSAEFIEKYFSKGMKADLSGRIQTGSYTNRDGQKVYATDIVVEEIEFGESKGVSIYYSSNSNSILTDSFGYTGDWRESLRKRPK